MTRLTASRGLAFCFAVVLGACTSQVPPEPSGHSGQPLAGGTTQDWSLLGDGQCLLAMQRFYPAMFGASVPIARESYTGSCAPEGACHVWLDDIPSASTWERIVNDGAHSPAPYDLVVYPPAGKNPYGHIASVDHVDDDGTIWVMDANWNGDERRSYAAHTTPGYTAYGWYHLRSLGPATATTTTTGAATADDPNTCGNIAKRLSFGNAQCEWNGNGACRGTGLPSSDCAHCCDADNPAPAATMASCGDLAASLKWGDGGRCEWNGNGACDGVGPQTADCDHCCVR